MSDAAPSRTRVCLLTPLGQGGLAAVRIFGPQAGATASRLFRPQGGAVLPTEPDRLTLGRVVDPDCGETIDQAILRVLPGGLGAEVTLHGGVRIVQRVVSACRSLGAAELSPARPRDRQSLWRQSAAIARAEGRSRPGLQADVEMSLPQARTRSAVTWLLGQGTVGLRDAVESLIARLGGGQRMDEPLERLLAERVGWRRAVAGVRVAIVGPVNAGKSTLLNALAAAPAAVVSDQPGTTRDYIGRWVNLDGLAAELIDTAGQRGAADYLEARATALAGSIVRSADLRLILLDGSRAPGEDELAKMAALAEVQPVLLAVNKSDLPPGWDVQRVVGTLGAASVPLSISARTGSGLGHLREAIRQRLDLPELNPVAAGLFCDRQVEIVRSALAADDPICAAGLLGRILDE